MLKHVAGAADIWMHLPHSKALNEQRGADLQDLSQQQTD